MEHSADLVALHLHHADLRRSAEESAIRRTIEERRAAHRQQATVRPRWLRHPRRALRLAS
jgi:hypothetical protein